MQNALKVIEVSGEEVEVLQSSEEEAAVLNDDVVSVVATKSIYVSAEEISSACLMVASLERLRIEPHHKAIQDIETQISELNDKILELKRRLGTRKIALKNAQKSFGRVQLRLNKLTNTDMSFDDFVMKLHT